jgi:hypothetical protein
LDRESKWGHFLNNLTDTVKDITQLRPSVVGSVKVQRSPLRLMLWMWLANLILDFFCPNSWHEMGKDSRELSIGLWFDSAGEENCNEDAQGE